MKAGSTDGSSRARDEQGNAWLRRRVDESSPCRFAWTLWPHPLAMADLGVSLGLKGEHKASGSFRMLSSLMTDGTGQDSCRRCKTATYTGWRWSTVSLVVVCVLVSCSVMISSSSNTALEVDVRCELQCPGDDGPDDGGGLHEGPRTQADAVVDVVVRARSVAAVGGRQLFVPLWPSSVTPLCSRSESSLPVVCLCLCDPLPLPPPPPAVPLPPNDLPSGLFMVGRLLRHQTDAVEREGCGDAALPRPLIPLVALAAQDPESSSRERTATYLLGGRRGRQGPGAEVDEHDQQDRDHPLQQLLVGQLNLVRRLDAVSETRQVFISSAVYVTQKPMWRVHLVAMQAYVSRIGNMAAISRYMKAQPSSVMVRKIGLATLNTFTFRCWYMYSASTTVNPAHITEKAPRVQPLMTVCSGVPAATNTLGPIAPTSVPLIPCEADEELADEAAASDASPVPLLKLMVRGAAPEMTLVTTGRYSQRMLCTWHLCEPWKASIWRSCSSSPSFRLRTNG
uniref:Uncharacterized protein n=1 Tax=Anopheles atroparvus TaxID=41427 RepID=A0A182IJG9_ANOAO